MTDCTKCKHFIYCDPYKILLYKGLTSVTCEEFREMSKKQKVDK